MIRTKQLSYNSWLLVYKCVLKRTFYCVVIDSRDNRRNSFQNKWRYLLDNDDERIIKFVFCQLITSMFTLSKGSCRGGEFLSTVIQPFDLCCRSSTINSTIDLMYRFIKSHCHNSALLRWWTIIDLYAWWSNESSYMCHLFQSRSIIVRWNLTSKNAFII